MNPAIASRRPAESFEGMARPPSPRSMLLRCLVGNQLQQAIHVAASLGVADALAEGPLPAEDLAPIVGARPKPLGRLLGALASFGIFEQQPDGRFALTPAAALLRKDDPGSLRPFAMWSGSVSYHAFGDLEHSVRTGTPAFEHLFGKEFFEFLAEHSELGDLFDDMMSWNTRPLCPAIAGRDFSRAQTIVDLGGGRGELLAAVLAAHPHLRGTLVDSRIMSRARETLSRAGVESRCALVCSDILDHVPEGADVYLLKSVLHGLDDEHARRVLENCRRAMGPDATLLTIELLLPEANEPSPARLMDLLMLVGCQGRERTRAEFEALFADAGFEAVTIEPAAQAFSVIEAHARSTAGSLTR